MNKRKIGGIIAIPLILGVLYSGLKYGYVSPMIKGLDVHILGGTFITNINKYVIKVGDKVGLSAGDYIVVPGFSQKPNLKFAVLDDSGVLSIKGNTLIAEKEGYSSIGILNKNRVLRKVAIMVVNPKINNMQIDLSNPIKYYGDKAKIESTVDIDEFKKLEKGYKLNYSTTNPKVLKISGNIVEAVGIGESKLISRYDRKEIQTSIKVLPRVNELKVDKVYDLEEGQSMQINPEIQTSPSGAKTEIRYDILDSSNYRDFNNKLYDENRSTYFGDSGLETTYGIKIDRNGNLVAKRVGNYLVELSSGEKKVKTVIEVKPRSFKNIEIKNLQYMFKGEQNKINVELGWDYDRQVKKYRIYVKPKDGDYSLYTVAYVGQNYSMNGNRISELIRLDIEKGKPYDYQIYVVGYNGEEETKQSNVIRINNNSSTDFQEKQVNNLYAKVDRENATISFTWSPIDKGRYTYRIYSKNRDLKEAKYILEAKNIYKNKATIKVKEKTIDYDFYIVAIDSKGQISGFSEPVRVRDNFSD